MLLRVVNAETSLSFFSRFVAVGEVRIDERRARRDFGAIVARAMTLFC